MSDTKREEAYKEAEDFLRKWLGANEQDSHARFALALVLAFQGRLRDAESEYFRVYLASQPNAIYLMRE